MAEKFEVTYFVEDGYVGESPQRFKISEDDIEEDMNEIALESLLDDFVQDDFEQKVTPYVKDKLRADFLEWAKDMITEQLSEEENVD